MEIPTELYTIDSLFSLTGSATAVWIITSVAGYLLELKNSVKIKKWLGFALSMLFALLGATLVQEKSFLIWIVAVVNGFVIYFTAVGANTIIGKTLGEGQITKPPVKETSSGKRGNFTELWW